MRRATSTYGLTQAPSQSPEGGRLQKTQSDAEQFRRLPDNPNYDHKIVVSVAPKDDRVFNFEFDRATTLLGITFKNVSEVPEDYPDSLPQTWLYADLMVAVAPGWPKLAERLRRV